MSLLSLHDIALSFGPESLLNHANLTIEAQERICIIGRNGAGKSSLLQLIEGTLAPDDGKILHTPNLRIAKLQQNIPSNLSGTIYDCVAAGLGKEGELLQQYHVASVAVSHNESSALLETLHRLQTEIETLGAWQMQQQIDTILSKMQLDPDTLLTTLSGGLLRRVLLAKALATNPDILLLDEPTNHLDIETIEWLENFLLGFTKTLIFITHDRSLVKRIATRIVEIEYSQLHNWECDFKTYLLRKAAQIEARNKAEQLFDKRLAEEEKWIRKGIQARRTRNEGRVRQLQAMRKEKANRRKTFGNVKLDQHDTSYSGKRIFDIHNLSYQIASQPIITSLSMHIVRGDKIGIIGKNGSGKSTFLKLLLNELQPDSGTIKRGTHLQWCYFDQKRERLDETKSVIDNVCEEGEHVIINGRSKHIITYLRDFLFTPERSRALVKTLSGGERNRLLLARLFMHPSNLLILDEPTNDLDAETLELLEERLIDYQGTLLLVSHDRSFINNVVTSTLVFSGDGQLTEYVGGYDDYLRQRSTLPNSKPDNDNVTKKVKPKAPMPNKTKLTFKEKYALEQLPAIIEKLEDEQTQLLAEINKPNFYKQPSNTITERQQKLANIQKELEYSYSRWEALEKKL